MTDKPISAIKAFEADMTCRGFQFEQGKTYTHEGKVKACESGFHVITGHPLEVFRYYTPAGSRFFRVEISGSTHSDDGEKTAAEILTIGEEIGHAELIADAVKYVLAKAKPTGAAINSGFRGAAINSGTKGVASNSGTGGVASNSGTGGAASNSGDRGAAINSGFRGAASNSGPGGAAADFSGTGRVMGIDGSALFSLERDDSGIIVSTASGIVGQDGIEAGTWYRCQSGKLVAA